MQLITDRIAFSKSKLSDSAVLLTLCQLRDGRIISRRRIAEEAGLTERSVRNALDLLRENSMVEVDSWGVSITDYGKRLLSGIGVEPVDLDMSQWIAEEFIQCIVVRRAASRLDDGREQRAAAADKGCESCSIWALSDGRLTMVPGWNADLNDPVLAGRMRMKCGLSEGTPIL